MSSSMVADNVTDSYVDIMEMDNLTHRRSGDMPTLEQQFLLRKDATGGDGSETPIDHTLSVGEESRSLPFVLSFNNLTYCVKVSHKMSFTDLFSRESSVAEASAAGDKRTKTLLNDISGEARDGEIMAFLGPSGSGKSTLIDALANRIAKRKLKGSVKLNGESLESRLLKVISAYVRQDDVLFPMLTVEETLTFAAEFRLPRSLSKSKKNARVQALIDQLGLRNAAKTVIGDEDHRGVSGGERRRVSIGIEIIHDPIVLFLDEPTSGLDSTSTFMVVKVLQRIAQSGSIVIMSIHQPGGTESLVEFNQSWQSMTSLHPVEDLPQNSRSSLSLRESISASISKGKLVSGTTATNNSNTKSSSAASKVRAYANPFWIELLTLSKRSITNSRRMPELFGIRLGAVMVTGLILATMFWQLDNTPKGVQERIGFFAFAMSTTFYTTADALPVFIQERYIFMRETSHNAYRRWSYVVSHALVALPALLFLSLGFAALTFWAVGLEGGFSGFLFYFTIIFASFWAGNSFVSFLSGVVRHVMIGYTMAVAILAHFLLFSGFFINRDRIPGYWKWFHYMSLVKYPYEAVLQNEFSDAVKCFVRGVQIFDNTPLASVPDALKLKVLDNMSETLGMNITASTCLTTGTDLLKQNAVLDLSKWKCVWITVAWGFLFRILFYLALLVGSKNKRSS